MNWQWNQKTTKLLPHDIAHSFWILFWNSASRPPLFLSSYSSILLHKLVQVFDNLKNPVHCFATLDTLKKVACLIVLQAFFLFVMPFLHESIFTWIGMRPTSLLVWPGDLELMVSGCEGETLFFPEQAQLMHHLLFGWGMGLDRGWILSLFPQPTVHCFFNWKNTNSMSDAITLGQWPPHAPAALRSMPSPTGWSVLARCTWKMTRGIQWSAPFLRGGRRRPFQQAAGAHTQVRHVSCPVTPVQLE